MPILASILAGALAAAAPPPPEDGVATVRAFVAAYNARDFRTFEAALAAGARWYNVEGQKVGIEGEGGAAIAAWTRKYLTKSCTTCRSELLSASASGRFVATVERASWTNRAGACVSQTSPAIYELAEGKIQAVWYFPASPQASCAAGK